MDGLMILERLVNEDLCDYIGDTGLHDAEFNGKFTVSRFYLFSLDYNRLLCCHRFWQWKNSSVHYGKVCSTKRASKSQKHVASAFRHIAIFRLHV